MESQRAAVSDALTERWDQKVEEVANRIQHLRKYGVDLPPTNKQQERDDTRRPATSNSQITKEYLFIEDEDKATNSSPLYSIFPLKLDMCSFENDPNIIIK
jgi:hypothetical protein